MSGPPTDLDDVLDLVTAEQARPERRCTYVGVEREGIRAELEALRPTWTDTLRVVRGDDGELRGAVVAEWDETLGRSWILGPWVPGDAAAWDEVAPGLLDAAISQLPGSVTRHEVCSDVSNELLAELAAERGWVPTEVNHALVADAETVAGWPDDDATVPIRDAVAGDVAAIAALHDLEFPDTYATAEQLVAGAADGSRVVLVVPDVDVDGGAGGAGGGGGGGQGLLGYAAGRVKPDGEGFVDFVAVRPEARGRGVGVRLVTALTRSLVAASCAGRVSRTVQDR
jgi:GNAT superfamily N-acetyltransferase